MSAIVLWLFWRIVQPFAITLIIAAVVAVLATPTEKRFRRRLKSATLSSFLVTLMTFVIVAGPLTTAAAVIAQQGMDLVNSTIADPTWRENFHPENLAILQYVPNFVREYALAIDTDQALAGVSTWARENVPTIFSTGAAVIFRFFLFFVCLFFFLREREKIAKEAVALSPFRDAVDRTIAIRLVDTVRGVIFGSLIVATVQGIVATIGLAVFDVPSPFIWGALVIIAAQIPMVGTAAVMVPAVLYLLATGHPAAALGLFVWSAIAVGLIDNILGPYIVGGRTQMHALLILISILGGIEAFGPVGFILGPTILAALLVILELYKAGILEKRDVA